MLVLPATQFEVRRDIYIPKNQDIKALGRYCGVIATDAFREKWDELQTTVPELGDIPAPVAEPTYVTMVHGQEIKRILQEMAGKDKPIKRRHASQVHSALGGPIKQFLSKTQHTIRPEFVRGAVAQHCEETTKLIITFNHDSPYHDNPERNPKELETLKPTGQDSLAHERRAYGRVLRHFTEHTLVEQFNFGMPVGELPYELGSLMIDEEQTVMSALHAHVNEALAAPQPSGGLYAAEGIFILDPPYITTKP